MAHLESLRQREIRKIDLSLQDSLHPMPWPRPLSRPDLAPACRPPEPEASGRSVDGRVCRAHLPAPAGIPPPLRWGRSRPKEAPQLPELQEFQVVYDQDRLGPAQILPTRGTPGCSLGGGECGGQGRRRNWAPEFCADGASQTLYANTAEGENGCVCSGRGAGCQAVNFTSSS